MRVLVALLSVVFSCAAAYADQAVFTYLKTVSVSELNQVLDTERTKFLATAKSESGYQLPAASTASNPVEIYTVRYKSRSPDLDNKKRIATGLLALPVLADRSRVPLISYQHGTVWGKYEVPSYAFQVNNPTGYPHYDAAYETRYMVALFAGNGYAVMASDYFGMGGAANDPEAYMIKQSSAQASYDLYLNIKKHLSGININPAHFFLGGWSQGGLNTTGFLELLEARGVKVTSAFTASAPNDPYAALNGVFYHPRALDAPWVNTIIALAAFSCENYRGPKGLAKSVIHPDYYEGFKSIYDRSYAGSSALFTMLGQWGNKPFLDYLKPAYRDPAIFANSDYAKCLAEGETYRQAFKTKLRMFYGSSDEVVRDRVAQLAYEYQLTLNGTPDAVSENPISLVRVEGADHRLTFVSGAVAAKQWMDGAP